jgi:hypothetical protein
MKRKPKQPRGKPKIKAPPPSTSRKPRSDGKTSRAKSSRQKVQAYRDRMRRRGMKLVQIWVPDPKSPHFAAEARRQAQLIAVSPHEKEDQAFIDSVSEWKPD